MRVERAKKGKNMNPILILQIVQGLLAAAPSIAEGIIRAKQVIEALFTQKLITAEQQNALKAHVDALGLLADAGVPPAAWQVEPDPA